MALDPLLPSRLPMVSDENAAYRAALTRDPEDEDTKKAALTERDRKKAIVDEAMERFRLAAEAESKQRVRELEDLRFDRAQPEDQWDEGILRERGYYGATGNGNTTPQRPCLVIPKLDQPVQQVLNEARNARLAIKIKPKGDGATKEGAELRQGLIRAIEVDSNAAVARQWALDRAVKCGRGVYRVLKTYANDGDFDLDLVITRILNQHAVYLDPYAKEPDWSDGEWAFIIEDIPKSEYKRRYKTSELNAASAEDLASIGDSAPGWVGDTTYRIAEYFYIEHQARWLILDPATGEKRMLDEGAELPDEIETFRQVDYKQVKWCVINACEVLDEEDWEGRWIPLVPVIGKEYNVNGERCWKGVISNSKDSQRSYNYMRSEQVVTIGRASKAPWLLWEGQQEGYEAQWASANTRDLPYLIVKPTAYNGEVLGFPQRNSAEPPIQAVTIAVQMADADIKSTTFFHDPSLGNFSSERSGKAIERMQQQTQQGSSNYLDNLATISMRHEARILLNLLTKIYDREGRLVRLLGESERDEQHVMLNAPFVPGPNGMPQPAPEQPPGIMGKIAGMLPGAKPPQKPKLMLLEETGDYSVVVSVGRSYQTQREENSDFMRSMMETAPDAAPMLLDLYAEQLDGPMGDKIADRLRKMNPQLAAATSDEQPEMPPAVQAQMQQMQQQMQQMGQALQQATQELKSRAQEKQMQAQADLQMKQMELDGRYQTERLKLEAGLAKQRMELESDEQRATFDAHTQQMLQRSDQQHEVRMATLQAAFDREAAQRTAQMAEQADRRNADTSDRQAVRDAHLTVATRPPETPTQKSA